MTDQLASGVIRRFRHRNLPENNTNNPPTEEDNKSAVRNTLDRLAHELPQEARLWNRQAAARYLGLSVLSLDKLIRAGEIPVVKVPGSKRLYFDRLDLGAFISKNKVFSR